MNYTQASTSRDDEDGVEVLAHGRSDEGGPGVYVCVCVWKAGRTFLSMAAVLRASVVGGSGVD